MPLWQNGIMIKKIKEKQSAALTDAAKYVRIPQAMAATGLSRSMVFEGIREGWFKSKLIKRRGATRGVRLINMESLLQWIESQPES